MLRHAGPSHDFYYNQSPIQQLQWCGRWLAVESCRRYTKPARMLRGLALLQTAQKERAQETANTVVMRILARLGRTELRSTGEACTPEGRCPTQHAKTSQSCWPIVVLPTERGHGFWGMCLVREHQYP